MVGCGGGGVRSPGLLGGGACRVAAISHGRLGDNTPNLSPETKYRQGKNIAPRHFRTSWRAAGKAEERRSELRNTDLFTYIVLL